MLGLRFFLHFDHRHCHEQFGCVPLIERIWSGQQTLRRISTSTVEMKVPSDLILAGGIQNERSAPAHNPGRKTPTVEPAVFKSKIQQLCKCSRGNYLFKKRSYFNECCAHLAHSHRLLCVEVAE